MTTDKNDSNNRAINRAIPIVVVLLVVVFAAVLFFTIDNDRKQQEILEESIRQQLQTSSFAARDLIDVQLFKELNTQSDIAAHQVAFDSTTQKLRNLRDEAGATYIYALKQMSGAYYFIFDTDEVGASILDNQYELAPVHEAAFLGKPNAGVLNLVDEFGSFNTGAVPIIDNGEVIGIVSTDIEDDYLTRSIETSILSMVTLAITMFLIMGILLSLIITLLRRVSKMQAKLYANANYDSITGLPNRYYLFQYLDRISLAVKQSKSPYAVLFIDLDNFKSVNDGAGHNTGDLLLKNIASFLEKASKDAKVFHQAPEINSLSARIGGDEFLLLLPGITSNEEASLVAQQLLDNFKKQPELQDFISRFKVGLSIGIALFDKHSDDYDELIKYADIAMYHAKTDGKNGFAVYSPEMDESSDKLELTVRKRR